MSVIVIATQAFSQESSPEIEGVPFVYTDWETFTTESTDGGLVNDHIFFLRADGDKLWIGTEGGLVMYQNGNWTSWTQEDGLPWPVVSSIAKSEKTGELWIGMFGGGIARFSGGYFEHFNQDNSGLINDVVYGITIEGDHVWVATTAGISSYNTVTGNWRVFTEKHAPMEEVWCYNANSRDGKVYFAVWGSGVLEWDVASETWTDYLDPDGEMEIDLYRDDGLVHVITTSVYYIDQILWASTYFGMSRYDGRNWRGYMDHDSGLPSNFINYLVARDGNSCITATDKGVGMLMDYESDTWVTYAKPSEKSETWEAYIRSGYDTVQTVPIDLDLPNHFSIAADIQGDDVWIGTGHGLARGSGTGFWAGLKEGDSFQDPKQDTKKFNILRILGIGQ
ncbi:MAG: regulator [Candidatus Marinimicrobia bacterium]|nr:regulator [Candidatus Neomarinimicrobiota bacterium]